VVQALLVEHSGIMEISGARKQKVVSAEALALVARVQARARAKRASHLKFFGILRDGTMSREGQSQQEDSGWGSSDSDAPNERVIGRDKAEAAGGDLVDPLGVEAGRKQSKSECMPTGSSCA